MAQQNYGFSVQQQDDRYQQDTSFQQISFTEQLVDDGRPPIGRGSGDVEVNAQWQGGQLGSDFNQQYVLDQSRPNESEMGSRYGTQQRQYQIDASYNTQLTTPRQQRDTLDYAMANSSQISGKQQFEARRSNRYKRNANGQTNRGWSNAPNAEVSTISFTMQQSTTVPVTKEASLTTPAMTEDEYRQWLTTDFKHLFDPFESQGGIPIADFEKMVRASDLHRTRNLNDLFKKLDKDGNNRVSWEEFFTGMKYTKKDEVGKSRKAFNSFVKGMTPVANQKLKKDREQAAEEGEPIPEESYLEAYNCRPPPLFIPLFYVAAWIFFIIYAVELQKGPAWNRVGWEKGFPFQSPLVFCPSVREQAWRFVSYSLLHDGYHHIVFNTIFSLLLGLPLECVHKAWRVGPVFFVGVLFGSLASSIIDPSTPLIGASGGVYALIGAHYALIVMNWEELQDDWTNIRSNPLRFLLSGVMRLIFLTVLVAVDFGLAFYRRYSGTTTLPTSAVAHIGGLLAGIFAGVPILRNIEKKPWESFAFFICIGIVIAMFLFGVFWNIFSTNFPSVASSACSNPSLVGLLGR